MKVCIRGDECLVGNVPQPITEFYKHKKMADGHLNKCKTCTKNDTKNRLNKLLQNSDFVESERKRGRMKYHRLYSNGRSVKQSPEKKREVIAKYKEKYPEKIEAKSLSGNILPMIKGNQLHHWSYNTEHAKDVIELSKSQHYSAHRFLEYDNQFKMYRAKETGELLDSKEKHLEYIYQRIAC